MFATVAATRVKTGECIMRSDLLDAITETRRLECVVVSDADRQTSVVHST